MAGSAGTRWGSPGDLPPDPLPDEQVQRIVSYLTTLNDSVGLTQAICKKFSVTRRQLVDSGFATNHRVVAPPGFPEPQVNYEDLYEPLKGEKIQAIIEYLISREDGRFIEVGDINSWFDVRTGQLKKAGFEFSEKNAHGAMNLAVPGSEPPEVPLTGKEMQERGISSAGMGKGKNGRKSDSQGGGRSGSGSGNAWGNGGKSNGGKSGASGASDDWGDWGDNPMMQQMMMMQMMQMTMMNMKGKMKGKMKGMGKGSPMGMMGMGGMEGTGQLSTMGGTGQLSSMGGMGGMGGMDGGKGGMEGMVGGKCMGGMVVGKGKKGKGTHNPFDAPLDEEKKCQVISFLLENQETSAPLAVLAKKFQVGKRQLDAAGFVTGPANEHGQVGIVPPGFPPPGPPSKMFKTAHNFQG